MFSILFIVNGGNRRRIQIGNEDLIILILAFTIGYIQNNTGPQEYEYQNEIVVVDKKYQCPTYCAVNHNHRVYFESETNGMVIKKDDLGEKIKKNKRKNKR